MAILNATGVYCRGQRWPALGQTGHGVSIPKLCSYTMAQVSICCAFAGLRKCRHERGAHYVAYELYRTGAGVVPGVDPMASSTEVSPSRSHNQNTRYPAPFYCWPRSSCHLPCIRPRVGPSAHPRCCPSRSGVETNRQGMPPLVS